MIKNIKKITFTLASITCLLVFNFQTATASNNEVLVAPIGKQQVVEGGGIRIFFNAFDKVVGGASFSSDDMPAFAQIIDNGDNTGYFAINTELGDHGVYQFHLNVSGTAGNSTVPVYLNVMDRGTLGRVFYCDPVNGSMSNVGDEDHPWTTLEAVFSSNLSIQDGDVIFLRNGYHGQPQVLGQHDAAVYINAQAHHQPKVRKLNIVFAKNWVISGLDISPEADNTTELGDYLRLVANAENVVVENCYIYAIEDSSPWTTNQHWYDHCGNGILNKGSNTNIRNNLISNTYFAVSYLGSGSHNKFEYNIVDRYGGDAIRCLQSHASISHNVITNAVVSDYDTGNHDDAFQSWTFGAAVKDVQIIGNIVFSCTDPDLPLKTEILQGIVCFDGFVEDWVVANNLVVIDHPHGIALYGAKNSKVVNNTVLPNPLRLFPQGSPPWIRINKHKDGRASTGNLARNNIAGSMVLDDVPGSDDHNTISTNYNLNIRDYENWDFHLLANAPAINSGFVDDAPLTDNEGLTRLPTNNPDRGCFEYDADVYDTSQPSVAGDFEVMEQTHSSLLVAWTPATDDTAIAHYEIDYNGIQLQTNDTEAWICNLPAGQTVDLKLTTIDYTGNRSESLTLSTSTLDINLDTYSIEICADTDDQQIRSDERLEWVGQHELAIGAKLATYNLAGLIPFELPALGDLEEIKYASLNTHFIGLNNNNTPSASLSLFGLASSYTSAVSADYFWQGHFNDNTEDTPILQDYITPQSNSGFISMDSTAMQSLAAYINQQYEQGAQAGDFIFLRLNMDTPDEQAGNYYRISSADALASKHRPVLKLDIGLLPNAVQNKLEEVDGLKAFPNPIAKNQRLYFDLPEALQNDTLQLLIHNTQGHLVNQQLLTTDFITDTAIELNDLRLPAGLYQISIMGNRTVSRTKIIIH